MNRFSRRKRLSKYKTHKKSFGKKWLSIDFCPRLKAESHLHTWIHDSLIVIWNIKIALFHVQLHYVNRSDITQSRWLSYKQETTMNVSVQIIFVKYSELWVINWWTFCYICFWSHMANCSIALFFYRKKMIYIQVVRIWQKKNIIILQQML